VEEPEGREKEKLLDLEAAETVEEARLVFTDEVDQEVEATRPVGPLTQDEEFTDALKEYLRMVTDGSWTTEPDYVLIDRDSLNNARERGVDVEGLLDSFWAPFVVQGSLAGSPIPVRKVDEGDVDEADIGYT